ncbi:MAG: TlpA disulfide reductase family protein [Prevotella sp.]|uniref:TlpA disulfide reductase family protein n=1 Tax=Prevotella sp. TaxID=59823 RepID=UPI00258F69C3|nr:TlpA disulfide reductase family protein [Prevotella sp.]MDD6854574.1 TlpA disulfide reductase family protein [Prevotella sp.]
MKKIFLLPVLALQILSACGQGNNPQQPVSDTADHDTAWYAARMDSFDAEESRLEAEYRTIAASPEAPGNDAKIKEIYAKADSLGEKQKATILEIVRKFKSTKFPARYLSGNVAYAFNYEELKEICDPKSGYYNDEALKMAKHLLTSLEKRHPGLQYKDLTMSDMDGKSVRLSNWVGKGKYVLVDFWASWCGPCRQEMPNVVEAYRKYKSKNFEIVGVSFDERKGAWTAAVKQLGMTWPQMSDLRGWQSAAASVYGINSIPANVLLDPKGKIVAVDLRGDDLQTTLAGLLK